MFKWHSSEEIRDRFRLGGWWDTPQTLEGTEEIRSRVNLARSTFSRLQSCLWSRCEISWRKKSRVYQATARLISALRLRDVASTSIRRKDACSRWQWQHRSHSAAAHLPYQPNFCNIGFPWVQWWFPLCRIYFLPNTPILAPLGKSDHVVILLRKDKQLPSFSWSNQKIRR